LLTNITGMQVQRNKAIVGRNAFAHEAGIHQDGMLKERSTYEIMRPEDVGLAKTDLVLGKHSGRAALGDRARALGYQLTGEQLQEVFDKFKRLCDKKKEVYDADIAALIEQELHGLPEVEVWTMVGYKLEAHTGATPTVELTLRRGAQEVTKTVTSGDGPFDALFIATEQITGIEVKCRDFSIHSVTIGKDAQGEVTIEIEHGGQIYRGRGVSTDSIEASAIAFLNAINRVAATAGRPAQRVSPHEAAAAAAAAAAKAPHP
jgi:2-isopropylmalate synthase